MHRLRNRAIILLLLAFSLAGCSVLYSYGNIDRFIRWWIDDYITWDSTQENQLRSRLTAQLEWHQQTQLPLYRAWLETVDRTLENDIDVAQLAAASDQLQSLWQQTAVHLQGDIALQLATLSNDQVRELITVVRDKNADLKSEYDDMTPADLIKKRKRDMKRTIKHWLGPLDERQTSLIDAWARNLTDSRQQWLASRELWADALAEALRHRHEPQLFASRIHLLFATPEATWSPEFRSLSDKNRESTLRLLAELHNSRTPAQHAAEHKRIAHWLDHLDKLAAH